MTNLLLIGFGPHAKRIYFPISQKHGPNNNFQIVHAIDLQEKREDLSKYFNETGYLKIDITFLNNRDKSYYPLKPNVVETLDEIVRTKDIKGVIISTEPLAHVCYAVWALNKGLSILMDKPVSTVENVSSSMQSVETLLKDYYLLGEKYKDARKINPNIYFSLMAQRRFHPAFLKLKHLISEVFEDTNCPITSVQSFHSDGQWRMPSEIVDQNYHPYNQGYGKCSHSGYHSIDIVPWLLETTESKGKEIDNVDIFSNFMKPNDFIDQLTLRDYKRLFKDFDKYNRYSDKELRNVYKNYGEIDAFNSFSFKHGERVMSLGSINLVHNGFSQRNWVSANGRDLYKGNGRVRHETHFIEQGPFQAISYVSYQSKEVNPNELQDIYETGGEYHLDIHVFRNRTMFKKWKSYEKINIRDLSVNIMEGKSRGHQEDARRSAILEYVRTLNGKTKTRQSDYFTHERSTKLLYGIYKSSVLRNKNMNPLVNVSF